MFKSIFAKYLFSFMSIVIVSFALLATIVGLMTTDYSNSQRKEMVTGASQSVSTYMKSSMDMSEEDDVVHYIFYNYATIRRTLSLFTSYEKNLILFVTDTDGNILVTDSIVEERYTKEKIPQNIVDEVNSKGVYSDTTDMDGLLQSKFITNGLPIKNSEGKTTALVFALSDSRQLSYSFLLTKTILTAMLWVLVAVLIVVYILTVRIVSPLKKINNAVKEYSKGNFKERVNIKGNDEIAELALTMNNMAQSLEELENSRSTFLGNISHDLRTPLTSIGGFIDGMLDGVIPSEKYQYYLKIVSGEVKRLSRLVSSLLDITKYESGAKKLIIEKFDICEMAREILISFENKIYEKNLDVEFEAENDNIFAMADKDAIHQVLYNICDNGIKFSNQNGKYKISIKKDGKKVFVSVYNEGIGINKDDINHVFDRMYKTDKSRGLDKTGVGLGLYISKTIMDAHNQQIWVESVEKEYTKFIFTLELA